VEERIVNDGPEDVCFGCGQRNPRGLRLVFRREGGRAEADYEAAEELAGAPGVIHGGIQAALLDEVFGCASHGPIGPRADLVTVDFRLRYHRPAPTGAKLTVRGRVIRVDGRDVYVEGEIVDAEGRTLTTAEARWRQLRRDG
jgi:uncharacterized protein (TIGR00369 family)